MALGGSIQSGTLLRGLELFLYSRLTLPRSYSTVTSIIRSDKKYRAGPGIRVLLLARNHLSFSDRKSPINTFLYQILLHSQKIISVTESAKLKPIEKR